MIDNVYRNSFQEVYIILENTEEELLKKIPKKFIDFIKKNRNINYKTNISKDIEIDKQKLLKETESILSLIYRSYWATDEEKKKFVQNEHEKFIETENEKREKYRGKDIYEIFEEKKYENNNTLDSSLVVVKKDSILKKILNKIRLLTKFF